MRRLSVLVVGLSLAVLMPARMAAAATQLSIWPADYTYGTPAGQFAWSATSYGIGFEQSLGPFVSLQTRLAYGPMTNFYFRGAAMSGYTGSVVVGDTALRVGLNTGPIGLSAFGGYGGLFFNASGSTASDRVILQSSGARLGVEASVTPAPGVLLRGSYTMTTALTTNANVSVSSPPPAVAASYNGSGSGNEYEIALLLSPVPLTSVYAGYRSGTQQISWSGGGGNTTNTFSGWIVGVELRF
jgi:hypothetical protein